MSSQTPPPRSGRTPRRAYHHGDLRRALLDEALATVRDAGVEALTLRAIGARLGVSRTALYRHFADKEALVTAVATEGFRMLRERLAAAWEGGGRGQAGSRAMGVAYVRFALDNPSHYRVMFGRFVEPRTREPALAAEAEAAFQVLVQSLADLQRDGHVRDDDVVVMARHVWAHVHGMAMLAIDVQLPEPGAVEALVQYGLERLHTGIAPAPSAPAEGITAS